MATRTKTAKQQNVFLGPWKGVRDVGDAGQQDRAFLQDAINCHFQDPVNGGAVFARPGFEKITGSIGLETSSEIQGIISVHVSGQQYVFAFVNGKVYRRSGTTSWTDVTPVGVSISSAAIVIHAILFNGELIVNDSSNEPWRGTNLTSTPITGTEIEINTAGHAWAAAGKPTVRAGKLFFIALTINGTGYTSRLVWSEELDAATGYLQDGYTNSWDIIQTSALSERILAIEATNDALFYFRQYSIGAIYGAVNTDFATASTHDGISNDVGLHNRASSVLYAKDYLWFVNSSDEPCRVRSGSRAIEVLGGQLRQRISQARQYSTESASSMGQIQMAYVAGLDKVVMLFLPDDGSGTNESKHLYVFDATTGNYEGRWIIELTSQPASENPTAVRARVLAGVPLDTIGSVSDTEGLATLYVGGDNTAGSGGHIWVQRVMRAVGNSSTFAGDNGAAMHQSITTMLAPDEQNVEFHFDQVAIETVPDTTAVSLDIYTPYGSQTGLTMSGNASADSIQSSYDHGIQRIGLNATLGRWGRFVFHKNVAAGSTQHAFEQASVVVRPIPASPYSP